MINPALIDFVDYDPDFLREDLAGFSQIDVEFLRAVQSAAEDLTVDDGEFQGPYPGDPWEPHAKNMIRKAARFPSFVREMVHDGIAGYLTSLCNVWTWFYYARVVTARPHDVVALFVAHDAPPDKDILGSDLLQSFKPLGLAIARQSK